MFGIEDAHPNIKLFAKNQIKQAKKKDETISKKDETISKKDNKIGELQKDNVNLTSVHIF